MTIKEILEKYLKDNGYDGLCNCDCGCGLSDLMCCDSPEEDCVPAMRHNCEDCTIKTEGCDEMADAEVNSGCWKPVEDKK